MARLVHEERPGIIYHAAAYKHVPMLEDQPSKGVRMNIRGTRSLLEVALEGGVERFVLVSTDKAVKPSSAMGATKRIAEMLVADAAQRSGRAYVSVRFGNVLGSAGSVIPIFQEQLARGGPLTVTHPEMTRFFMTIPEAAWLILDASALGRSGDLFVLEMGEPVKIYDLARDLIRLAGRDPDSHPIIITGLRPGEKLHEELFYRHEEAVATESAKVLRVRANPVSATLQRDVDELLALATGMNEAEVREALVQYAREETARPIEPTITSGLPVAVGSN
jgi:FlaA1/EpsC-like NDP-sugar epimerase